MKRYIYFYSLTKDPLKDGVYDGIIQTDYEVRTSIDLNNLKKNIN